MIESGLDRAIRELNEAIAEEEREHPEYACPCSCHLAHFGPADCKCECRKATLPCSPGSIGEACTLIYGGSRTQFQED